MSGGPLIIDDTVVGVVSGTQAKQGDNYGWAIPVDIKQKVIQSVSPVTGKNLANLPPLELIEGADAIGFIKATIDVDIGELSGLEVKVIGPNALWNDIEKDKELKAYFDRGIKFSHVALQKEYDDLFLRRTYTSLKYKHGWDESFEEYLEKKDFPYSREDLTKIRKYNLLRTPLFIGYYGDKEISRYNKVRTMIEWVSLHKEGKAHYIKPDDLKITSKNNRDEFMSFLNLLVDSAKKIRNENMLSVSDKH